MNDNDRPSLLPFNASTLEKTLEQSIAKTTALTIAIDAVWNPEQCPESLLPWLAWALSVDTWDSEWPEPTKRHMIAESIQVHRAKGTVAAIERVTAALGVVAELSEWFQYNGPPHTFRLTAWANANRVSNEGVILSASLYRALKASIDSVKPVRSHYDFRIGAKFGSEMGLSCAASSHAYVPSTQKCELIPTLSDNQIAMATHAKTIAVVSTRMEFI